MAGKRRATPLPRDDGLIAAIEAAGGEGPLARSLGISVPSLRQWRETPSHRVVQVEAVTGILRERLRPDLYRTRDEGVRAAIEAAGGQRALARRLGIAVQSLRDWHRVPEDRIIQVESVTGVRREILRPDLYERNNSMNDDRPNEWRLDIILSAGTFDGLKGIASTTFARIDAADTIGKMCFASGGAGGGAGGEQWGSASVTGHSPVHARIKALREEADRLEAQLRDDGETFVAANPGQTYGAGGAKKER